MKKICLAILLVVFGVNLLFAQSKKLLRRYGIKSKTETVIKFKDGQEAEKYIEEREVYNEDGEWIEKISFNKNGEKKKIEKRVYNKGNLVEESEEEPLESESIKITPDFSHKTYTYEKDLLKTETKLNKKGEIKEIITYLYNNFGDIVEEIETDAEGNIKKRDTYSYDNRGLKEEKLTYDSEGDLIEKKIYAYE